MQFRVASAVNRVQLWMNSSSWGQWQPSDAKATWTRNGTESRAHNPCDGKGGTKGEEKAKTRDSERMQRFTSSKSPQICRSAPGDTHFHTNGYPKQGFPWFKAGLMWQTFKSSSVGAVLTWEIIKWVDTSFHFRMQFCSTPWKDKIPESQKCARLEEIKYSFQGHKKLFSQLCQIPGEQFILNLVYFSSFFLSLSSVPLNILKSQISCNSDSGAKNVHKMMWGIWFTANTELLHSTSRKLHCQSIPRMDGNPNKHWDMARDK